MRSKSPTRFDDLHSGAPNSRNSATATLAMVTSETASTGGWVIRPSTSLGLPLPAPQTLLSLSPLAAYVDHGSHHPPAPKHFPSSRRPPNHRVERLRLKRPRFGLPPSPAL